MIKWKVQQRIPLEESWYLSQCLVEKALKESWINLSTNFSTFCLAAGNLPLYFSNENPLKHSSPWIFMATFSLTISSGMIFTTISNPLTSNSLQYSKHCPAIKFLYSSVNLNGADSNFIFPPTFIMNTYPRSIWKISPSLSIMMFSLCLSVSIRTYWTMQNPAYDSQNFRKATYLVRDQKYCFKELLCCFLRSETVEESEMNQQRAPLSKVMIQYVLMLMLISERWDLRKLMIFRAIIQLHNMVSFLQMNFWNPRLRTKGALLFVLMYQLSSPILFTNSSLFLQLTTGYTPLSNRPLVLIRDFAKNSLTSSPSLIWWKVSSERTLMVSMNSWVCYFKDSLFCLRWLLVLMASSESPAWIPLIQA